ncbi:hypothetical protein ACFXK0_15260 [Nocardia sp. NPDC059177]|uniref:hypothetical protein n=1 Tax=Nocardia sp. NPDC059177 TaxID=3346759 RepID=UPI0036BAE2A7
MNSRGLLHLDTHFENILTDGSRLYFGDYGLALSADFDLSPSEAAFLDRNQTYDRGRPGRNRRAHHPARADRRDDVGVPADVPANEPAHAVSGRGDPLPAR